MAPTILLLATISISLMSAADRLRLAHSVISRDPDLFD
ncbi:hypothetical protein OP10G_3288 [Fimbriimonas ginsengisoli Gsoil 348]|uniref:Uncharacterized protein n=1 Tax=Fimbriimonas ginsengisoli Gsoil 348 TaxID=661478 RepID=A0A068NTA2_FIMGI|nr:hypothetical protein OP10G_3288 [Fimbriimonas ginsengisoli Gsoil 348]